MARSFSALLRCIGFVLAIVLYRFLTSKSHVISYHSIIEPLQPAGSLHAWDVILLDSSLAIIILGVWTLKEYYSYANHASKSNMHVTARRFNNNIIVIKCLGVNLLSVYYPLPVINILYVKDRVLGGLLAFNAA